jgi:hypothetical protein
MNDQRNISSIRYDHALHVWLNSPESKHWGPVDWIVGIRGRPSLVMLGADDKNGGETYAVVDVTDGRILDCDQLGADEIERLGVIPLRDSPSVTA